MTDLRFPLSGSTLLTGPSNVGKTTLTARALDAWVDAHGFQGVVVLEFAPVVERKGSILGGRLTQFTAVPDNAWHGVLDAHAPRADSDSEAEAVALARDNAERAAGLLAAAPEPTAVFVNDATIPFQHERGDVEGFLHYCDRATCAVLNAYESDELGTDDPVSRRERTALDSLKAWADRHLRLD